MVKVEGTEETTRNGMSGTVFTIRTNALTRTNAETRARGSMLTRFPSNTGKLEVVGSRKVESDIPGVSGYEVKVFVPHNNPRNKERVY